MNSDCGILRGLVVRVREIAQIWEQIIEPSVKP
jgi:hypothetical protein